MIRIHWIVVALMALTCVAAQGAEEQPFFSDVPNGHWAGDAVKKAANLGLVVGHGDGKFEGEKPPTRYELAMGMSKVLAELENRLKTFPGMSNEVLSILQNINLHFASELDKLRTANADLKGRINDLYRAQGKPVPYPPGEAKAAAPVAEEARDEAKKELSTSEIDE